MHPTNLDPRVQLTNLTQEIPNNLQLNQEVKTKSRSRPPSLGFRRYSLDVIPAPPG